MKIAFWSLLHGSGATSSLLAVASAWSLLHSKKTVVTQTHYNLNNLERPLLGTVGSGEFFRDTGIDALIRHFKSGAIAEDHIRNCSIKIGEHLYLLAGTKTNNREGFENGIARSMMLHIMSAIEKFYDVVFIDTNSGDNRYSMKVIEECDLTVVCFRQNRQLLDYYFEKNPIEGKKVFYLFPDYDIESKYSLHNIMHLYKEINRENSYFLPHDTGYMDAICDEKVMKYMDTKLSLEGFQTEDAFLSALRKVLEKIEAFLAMK